MTLKPLFMATLSCLKNLLGLLKSYSQQGTLMNPLFQFYCLKWGKKTPGVVIPYLPVVLCCIGQEILRDINPDKVALQIHGRMKNLYCANIYASDQVLLITLRLACCIVYGDQNMTCSILPLTRYKDLKKNKKSRLSCNEI